MNNSKCDTIFGCGKMVKEVFQYDRISPFGSFQFMQLCFKCLVKIQNKDSLELIRNLIKDGISKKEISAYIDELEKEVETLKEIEKTPNYLYKERIRSIKIYRKELSNHNRNNNE